MSPNAKHCPLLDKTAPTTGSPGSAGVQQNLLQEGGLRV